VNYAAIVSDNTKDDAKTRLSRDGAIAIHVEKLLI